VNKKKALKLDYFWFQTPGS